MTHDGSSPRSASAATASSAALTFDAFGWCTTTVGPSSPRYATRKRPVPGTTTEYPVGPTGAVVTVCHAPLDQDWTATVPPVGAG